MSIFNYIKSYFTKERLAIAALTTNLNSTKLIQDKEYLPLVYINRAETSEQGTFGTLETIGFSCFVGELPWKNNAVGLSCIPDGDYICKIRKSPRFGIVFHVTDVKGRSYILIHAGNFSGDKELGWKTHVEGCILLGKKIGIFTPKGYTRPQKAVLNSKSTLTAFMKHMNDKPFKLIVRFK